MATTSESEVEDTITNARKKRKYDSLYQSQWEEDPRFKAFISRSKKGKTFIYCKFCEGDLSIASRGVADIIRHTKATKHVSVEKSRKGQTPINLVPAVSRATVLKKQTRCAEVQFAAFIAEHNIAFNVAQHASELFQKIFSDSKIAQNFRCKRTKTTALIKNVLGESSYEDIIAILREKTFSLITDESTDIECIKHLCAVARYFDGLKVRDRFLTLIGLQQFDHEHIYNKLVEFFEANAIPFEKNLIGFAADGASVNFGKNHSISQLLKSRIPDLFTITCVCHSFAIVASNACEELPRFLEDMMRDIYSYIKGSTKRLSSLQMYQKLYDAPMHKILYPAQTRWLSLEAVVARLLEQYDPLCQFFRSAALEERLLAPQKIYEWLKEPQTKIFLLFLNFVLPEFNKLNRLFQSEKAMVHTVYESILSLYKKLLSYYMKPQYVEKAESISPSNPDYYLKLEDVYLGTNAMGAVETVDKKFQLHIRTKCMKFYIKACCEIKRKFNFLGPAESLLKNVSILNPKNVLQHDSLTPVLKYFNSLHPNFKQNVDSEFRNLRNHADVLDVSLPMEDFWRQVDGIKCGNDPVFPNLCSFVFNYILCLPCASANTERVFSTVTNNKGKLRNRLNTESLNGILHSKELLDGSNCYSLDVTKNILDKFNENMYRFTDNKGSDEDADMESD